MKSVELITNVMTFTFLLYTQLPDISHTVKSDADVFSPVVMDVPLDKLSLNSDDRKSLFTLNIQNIQIIILKDFYLLLIGSVSILRRVNFLIAVFYQSNNVIELPQSKVS